MKQLKKEAVIVASRTNLDLKIYNNENYFLIGVEQGCVELINQNVKLDLAIADFDHVSDDELKKIEKYAFNFQKLPTEKDLLDGQAALNYALDNDYLPMTLIINPSKRIDLNLSIPGLMRDYDDLTILNENSIIKKIANGINEIKFVDCSYLSFYSLFDDNLITLKNFKYNVQNHLANSLDLFFLSNSFIDNQNGIIENSKDLLMIISK